MKLSVIIPCFNEEKTLEKVVNQVIEQKKLIKEIIIVDDKSTDNSGLIIKKLSENYPIIKFILKDKNEGKGSAIKKGLELASGEIILTQDADLEYDPTDYKKILTPLLDGRADVVFGSRFLGDGEKRVLYFWHRVGNFILTLLSNSLSNLNLTDMEVGYKAFKTKILKEIKLNENRFGFEPEITAKIAKKKTKNF